MKESTMYQFYLGIDGGGTKTHCALFDRTGTLVDFVKWGTTSHEFLPGGYQELKGELQRMFDTIQQRNKLSWEDVSVVYGMAGVDCARQQKLISQLIYDCGVRNCLLCNDAFLGIKAGTDQGWGICSINGSGTGAQGIDRNGKTCRVGGLFEFSGDYAGGKILGSEVVSHVYDHLFRGGRKTELSRLLFEKFHADNREDLMEEIICRMAERTLEPKEFAPLLLEAACAKDETALSILSKCGEQNARDIIAVAKQLDFPDGEAVSVVLLGSLYTRAKHNQIVDSLEKALKQNEMGKEFRLIQLSIDPVIGAVCWAMENDKRKFDRNRISSQIESWQWKERH
ncbi:MAG: N-acetylglucosamine kinase [Caldicoprobacterales bacterium]